MPMLLAKSVAVGLSCGSARLTRPATQEFVMHETVPIPPTDLVLDMENARLGEVQGSQPETYLALAKTGPKQLVQLCTDIVEHGLDPLSEIAVVATGDKRQKYRVLEGNRRVLAVKVLETPTIVVGKGILTKAEERQVTSLSARYQKSPIDLIECVLFDSETTANHWIVLRHTGENDGRGLRTWHALEKERYRARHKSGEQASPAAQVIDFVEQIAPGTVPANSQIATTLTRMMSTPQLRRAYGLEMVGGELVGLYPASVLSGPLTQLVQDLVDKKIKVAEVYSSEQRVARGEKLQKEAPISGATLASPVRLSDLSVGDQTPAPASKPRTRKSKPVVARSTVVPASTGITPTQPRINAVFNELSQLDMTIFPNAASVLLRVFIELSVHHEIKALTLMTDDQQRSTPLAKRMKTLADELAKTGAIDAQLKTVVHQAADNDRNAVFASATTFNQYVHNGYIHPAPADLRAAWDTLQPFIEKITR